MVIMDESFYKVLMVGPEAGGKSSLLHFTKHCAFDPTLSSTAGADFCIKEVGKAENGDLIKLQMWDLAGSKAFQGISKAYLPNSKACIFVVDASNPNTYDTTGWKDFIWEWEAQNADQTIGLYIIALNKVDLEDKATISNMLEEYPLEWATDKKIPIVSTSAKTGQGVKDLFALLTNMLIYEKNINLKPQSIDLKNIVYIPESWSDEKRRKLNLVKVKEGLIMDNSKESLTQTPTESSHPSISHNNDQSYIHQEEPQQSEVSSQGVSSTSKQFHETNAMTKDIPSNKENLLKKESDFQDFSKSSEDMEQRIEHPPPKPEIPEESIIKNLILEEFSDIVTNPNLPSKEKLKDILLERFCPKTELYKIKQIQNLTVEKLLELIKNNIDEEVLSDPSEIDRYFISYKIFNSFNKTDESFRSLNQIISIADSNQNLEWKSFAVVECAEIFKQKNQFDKAIQYYEKAIEIDKSLEKLDNVAFNLNHIASIYYKRENYSKALNYFQDALKVDKELGNIANQANREYWIGAIFSKINQNQNAVLHLKNALRLYTQLGHHEEAEEVRSFIDQIELY